MSEHNDKRGSVAGCALWVGLLLLFVLALYVLGIGPASWLGNHYPETQEFVATVYLPLALVADYCQPIGRALEWYAEFWI